MGDIWHNLVSMDISWVEKVLRTVGVYLGLAIVIRVFGKRLMSQMNSIDLVVVLLLSNVVQNAVIGPDNSLTGGLLGAVVLVGLNSAVDSLLHHVPALHKLMVGDASTVLEDGRPNVRSLRQLGITPQELAQALRHQGADDLDDVKLATIEPGGSIVVQLKRERRNTSYGDLRDAIVELRQHVDDRMDELGRVDRTAP